MAGDSRHEQLLMKSALLAAIVVAFSGCSAEGRRVDLLVGAREDAMALSVENHTDGSLALPKHLVLSGKGGGDIAAMIVDQDGRLRPPCATVDVLTPRRELINLAPGDS